MCMNAGHAFFEPMQCGYGENLVIVVDGGVHMYVNSLLMFYIWKYPVLLELYEDKDPMSTGWEECERLRRIPADKPIGDAQDVAVLLWDYQNWDLDFLLLQWENVLGDLHVSVMSLVRRMSLMKDYRRR